MSGLAVTLREPRFEYQIEWSLVALRMRLKPPAAITSPSRFSLFPDIPQDHFRVADDSFRMQN
jgi:hypothetical protein